MPGNEIDLKKEMELIAEKIKAVKQAGHGEIVIKVADGRVVHITHSIGEQIKSK